MQALNCTTQQVSKDKMGSCSPAKAHTTLAFGGGAAKPLDNGCSVASWPFRSDPVLRFWIGATAREQWHQPCPYHTTMLVGADGPGMATSKPH